MSNSSHRASRAPESTTPLQSAAADPKRRRFLLALGAGGAGAAAVATRALAQPIAPAATGAEVSQGYRETDHVRDYYATTRI